MDMTARHATSAAAPATSDIAIIGMASRVPSFTHGDAELLDPQHRLFLEAACEALDHAGYAPSKYAGRIGVYAGAGLQSLIASDKDDLATRVSHTLSLRGPSVGVSTVCSTSLVVVHMACHGLLLDDADIALAGEIFGNGLGIVVLKRLDAAIADGDTIHAVIKGTAINNDGAMTTGYTAPSVQGQAGVLTGVLDAAGVPAVVGLIEAALCVRDGVSSFGVDGTNAHAMVEEPPNPPEPLPTREWNLVLLSARTPSALEQQQRTLAQYVTEHPAVRLEDVASTLQIGRADFEYRRACLCRAGDAASSLAGSHPSAIVEGVASSRRRPAFVFPGLGNHYAGMGRGLYRDEPVFARAVDRCAELFASDLPGDLRDAIGLNASGSSGAADLARAGAGVTDLRAMLASRASGDVWPASLAHPAVFTIEYALAQLCLSWGLEPDAVAGYSLGEFTAACVAGIASLDDMARIVMVRAKLIDQLPAGTMAAVPLRADDVAQYLTGDVDIAAMLAPKVSVLAGTIDAIEAVQQRLRERDIVAHRLPVSRPFHSRLMDVIVAPLAAELSRVRLAAPKTPCLSNSTGTWLTADEATNPEYWAKHLSRTVRFADCVNELFADPQRVAVEVGPGRALTSAIMQCSLANKSRDWTATPLMRAAYDEGDDRWHLLRGLARLWVCGTPLGHARPIGQERARRIPLPSSEASVLPALPLAWVDAEV
jgi:acyl transferase domain-containing protein